MIRIPHFRWFIITLVFLAAALNYVDRQALSSLAPSIQRDLAMDDRDYANIVNLFLVAYTIAYVISGRIVDRVGTRTSMVIFLVWWSVANMLTAAASGVRSLGGYRFLLGLGEAGLWPAASKVVAEWFPARERALGIALYTMGATVGATVAPYIVIPLATYPYHANLPFLEELVGPGVGWRMAFIITGALGLVWLLPWLLFYRLPRESKLVTVSELAILQKSASEEKARETILNDTPWTWRQIFTNKIVWLLLLGRLITDPVWYFYQFWFAKYLHTVRQIPQEQLTITWVVYAAAGAGSLLGGWLSGLLVRRGIAPAKSRLWVMLGSGSIMPVSVMIPWVDGIDATMILTVVVVLAALAWMINLGSIVVDVTPRASLGTVFGVVAAGSTIGGIMMNTLVSIMVSGPITRPTGFLDQTVNVVLGPLLEIVRDIGYGPWFFVMACLHPIALVILWRFLPLQTKGPGQA
jgi:ACS family hexuronate transporter-like MFS transporter